MQSTLRNSGEMSGSTGPARLKQPQSGRPEQVNLVFTSVEENIPSSIFMTQAEERKVVFQWEQLSNFNRLVITMAYVKPAMSKPMPATTLVRIEKREKAKAIIFKLLQQEESFQEMKSLKIEMEISKSSKVL